MESLPDLTYLNHLLVEKMRVKRRPVAVTYCSDGPPPGYEPVDIVACGIVRAAEQGRRIYVDRHHHDCWVGQYHLGWNAQPGEYITEGGYLTDAQGFYTPEAARCNKQQSHSLPEGMITALAAAPLDEVPDGVPVDLLICVVDPQRAMQIAGAASVRIGQFPLGELGASACSSIFAAPYITKNSVFAIGDGGGRMHNRLDAGEMFVSIPRDHLRYVVELVENFHIDPQKMREVIMPSYATKAKDGRQE
ncbi:DUF169 domain-containing protein [Oscillochloris sp. ZM17-4]|uniref:DUF169 domain-containing protein n=1 Tax=Oscillochloris sp. ZM17-4 TaxID=2866714 RepID=UPI001C72C809|nr:DUF169 domain-containing protein [Oscillochloris sp. ZM17-4]MBX0326169.1 DUF169 domain-containing protein [Oscillochloris sp. ZM17-4]